MERILQVHESPEAAKRATRRAYQAMTPNERVALTVELQRRYYSGKDSPQRLERVFTVREARPEDLADVARLEKP